MSDDAARKLVNLSINRPPSYEHASNESNGGGASASTSCTASTDNLKGAASPDTQMHREASQSIQAGSENPPVNTAEALSDLQKVAAREQGTILGIPRRLILVILSCLGLTISYADRSNIAIAIIPMSKEFGWSPAVEGAIFSCFFYGYMATQLLGGYLADRFGGKWVFGAGMSLWLVCLLY